MASSSIVGLTSRTYRSGGGTGVRSRFRLGSTRGLSVVQSAASSSIAQWAAEQHQELLAARDLEAMQKLAAGGTEDFIQYAMERIAALGDGEMKDHWNNLLASAQKKAGINKVNNTVKQYAAMLQAGEMAGDAFLSYLQSQLGNYDPSSDEYTYLVQTMADAKKWVDLSVRALEKRHDEEMAAWVQEQGSSKEALQTALDYYKSRRDKLKPDDEAFGTLTKTIADVQTAIAATDFNAQINAAHAKLIAGQDADPVGAKQEYLGTLVKLMNGARDPAAQQKLFELVQTVRESISKDKILQAAQETNAKMVAYFDPNGDVNSAEILQFLAKKAAEATDPAEAARYSTLASQVIAHERQKAADAVAAANRASGGAGGIGLSSEVVNRALNPYEDAYKDALAAVNNKLDRGLTPTQADWAILYETRSNYQNVIGQAYTQANATAKGTLDNTERSVRNEAGSGTGWDFGAVGDKMAAKIVNDIKTSSDDIARLSQKDDNPELQMKAIAKQLADIAKAKQSPFLQIAQDEAAKLTGIQESLNGKVADVIRDSTDTILGNKTGLAIGGLSDKFDVYAAGGGRQNFDQWMQALSGAQNAREFSRAVGDNVTPAEFVALTKLIERDATEQQTGMSRLISATQFRLPNGEIDPAWQAGGALDESTRAKNIQRILDGTGSAMDLITAGTGGPSGAGASAFAAGAGPTNRSGGGATNFGTPTFPAPLIPPIGKPPGGYPSPLAEPPPQTDVVQPGGEAVFGGGAAPGDSPINMQPIDASNPQPAEPDPWAAGGFLDESTRAAMRASGFAEPDPHTQAWEFLNTPTDFALPSFTVPDWIPEPSFMTGDYGDNSWEYGSPGGPSLSSGSVDGSLSLSPPPATSFTPPDDWSLPEPSAGSPHGPY